MKYELNDKPGMLPMLMYGLQWWIVSLPCVVIMGIIVSQLHYTNVAEQTFYLQKLFGIMGIVMIVQVLWGHRLPLIIGPASVLLIGILSTVSSGIPAVYTGIMVGGLVLTVLAYSGLLGKLQFVFTPRIVTVILILIAFTLTPVILKLVLGDAVHALFNLFLTLVMVLALVIGNKLLRGIWKSTTVLWGIVGGRVGVLRGVWFSDVAFNGSRDNTGTNDCFKLPVGLRGGDDSGILILLYSFDRERAWFNTGRWTYVTG